MEIIFSNPLYLWGLLAIPVLIVAHFVALKYSKAMALKFANFIALSRVSGSVGDISNTPALILRIVVLVCFVLSISGMTLWYSGNTLDKDYVLVIDSSSSMLADDFSPTRLSAARVAAISFVDNLPINSKVGLVSFSGTSFVDSPLSMEKDLIKESINNFKTRAVGGTDFGGAIITAANVLIPSSKSKSIVLLTDGRSNIGVSDSIAIRYALDNHVTINTIGIGSVEAEDLDLGVDEDALRRIANRTSGTYNLAKDGQDLKDIYTNIVTTESVGKIQFDFSLILLILGLVLLFLDWILGSTIYRQI